MQIEKLQNSRAVRQENIEQRTFDFALRIVNLCRVLIASPGVGRTLGHQLLRSGTSVGANVHEAQAGQSRADFVAKMSIAHKEARETMYWIRLIAETKEIASSRIEPLLDEAQAINRILAKILVTTKQRSG